MFPIEYSRFKIPGIAFVVVLLSAVWAYYVTRGPHDEFATLSGHRGGVFSMALAPGGSLMASGGGDGTVRIWNVSSQRSKATLRAHQGWVTGLAWSSDGETIASCGADRSVRLWNVGSGKELIAWSDLPGAVNDVAISADGKNVAGAVGKFVYVWTINQHDAPRILSGHQRPISGIKFLPGRSEEVATFAGEGSVRIWDVSKMRLVVEMPGPIGHCYGMSLSNDGKIMACVGGGRVHLYDLEKRVPLDSVEPNAGIICGAAFSPDGRTLAVGSQDKIIVIWDILGKKERSRLNGHDFAVAGMSFLPDGKTLVTSSHDSTLKLWNVK